MKKGRDSLKHGVDRCVGSGFQVGLDVGAHVASFLSQSYGERMQGAEGMLDELVGAGFKVSSKTWML